MAKKNKGLSITAISLLTNMLVILVCSSSVAQKTSLTPILSRVNVQADTARISDIVDNKWVAVGINRPHVIQKDGKLLFNGKPSYRFELKSEDNSLEGYEEGSTKGRAELSYIYATSADYKNLPAGTFAIDQVLKEVYSRGKGQCKQGSKWSYTFSVYIPSSLSESVNTIFAQWHGMPSRTLVQDSLGKIMQLTPQEFVKLSERMIFKKEIGYEKIKSIDKKGNVIFKAGEKNGWKIEQGGYPPLAMGFSKGMFNILANSDSRWMTDKTDRTNANASKAEIMKPVRSEFKSSTIAYKMPFADFPKDKWITFKVDIDWSVYGREKSNVVKPGKLDVIMQYNNGKEQVENHIVDNQKILIGRNDDHGYYFKFGIYRTGSSTVPVVYNLAGYSEKEVK